MKKMKKVLCIVLAALFLFTMAACTEEQPTAPAGGSGTSAATAATASAGGPVAPKNGDTFKIGYSNEVLVYNSWITLEATLSQLCADEGWEYIKTDANGDPNKQIADLEDLNAQSCDLIFINTTDPEMMTPTINKIVDSGTPVVSLDNVLSDEAKLLTTITANNRQNGILVGNWAADKVKGDIKAVIVSGEKASNICVLRREGCLEGITERRLQTDGNVNIEIVAQMYTDWFADQSISQMEDILARNVEFNLVISEADVMALPIYDLLKQRGMENDVIIASTADAQKEALELIQTCETYATGLNSFIQQAELARDTAKAYFAGETEFPDITYTESACITTDNVANYYDPNATF
ncbi:MAG: substrate-binding domain-containing protein [Clostridiales Family XIII bacterium]|jgi:ribose transport system substrate-binding protein|nr:substrate-binding domain-containing protein [Clostridiales Family XIII bacterium]